MSVPVPLEELRREVEQRAGPVYLLTVSEDASPHCVAVTLDWCADELVARSGTRSVRNAAERPRVTLLFPARSLEAASSGTAGGPSDPSRSGYSLIVDGTVSEAAPSGGGGGVVRIAPAHAVLHRPAVSPEGPAHDCVPVFDV